MTEIKHRPLAVVTGASSGIGLELARQFADHGFDLIVNAEDDAIETAAAGLRQNGCQVQAVRADLRRSASVEDLYAAIRSAGRPLAAAALNAGVGQGGAFVDQNLDDIHDTIDLNVTSTVHLAHLVLRDMVRRNDGRVLITSSIASTMPGSYHAIYNASKAFHQSFAYAIQDELKDSAVTVTSLMPGPTDTDFFARADMEDTRVGHDSKDDPADVARMGFEALMAGKSRVVASSVKTKVHEAVDKVLPDRVKAALHGQMAKPDDGSDGP